MNKKKNQLKLNKLDQTKTIKALFPITMKVTMEIIKQGKLRLYNTEHCIGAIMLQHALKDQLPEGWSTHWGAETGAIFNDQSLEVIRITTTKNINIMHLEKSTTVTLITV